MSNSTTEAQKTAPEDRRAELRCGLAIVNLAARQVVGAFWFHSWGGEGVCRLCPTGLPQPGAGGASYGVG